LGRSSGGVTALAQNGDVLEPLRPVPPMTTIFIV